MHVFLRKTYHVKKLIWKGVLEIKISEVLCEKHADWHSIAPSILNSLFSIFSVISKSPECWFRPVHDIRNKYFIDLEVWEGFFGHVSSRIFVTCIYMKWMSSCIIRMRASDLVTFINMSNNPCLKVAYDSMIYITYEINSPYFVWFRLSRVIIRNLLSHLDNSIPSMVDCCDMSAGCCRRK